jgi:protocatechuate 3,4-dioxygenase beta subunit
MTLTRREAIAGLGTVTLGTLLAGCGGDGDGGASGARPTAESTPFDESASCVLTAEQTEGPFYIDTDSIRSDIREDRAGKELRLAIRVRAAGDCTPLANAVVDVWHCDASGGYSGVEGETGETYLRGAQVTDADGMVEFRTIYPGWYPGRTPHIHLKVHLDSSTLLTTQLYFDEATSDRVYANPPYRQGRDATNATDGIFDDSLVLALREEGDAIRGSMTIDVRA